MMPCSVSVVVADPAWRASAPTWRRIPRDGRSVLASPFTISRAFSEAVLLSGRNNTGRALQGKVHRPTADPHSSE